MGGGWGNDDDDEWGFAATERAPLYNQNHSINNRLTWPSRVSRLPCICVCGAYTTIYILVCHHHHRTLSLHHQKRAMPNCYNKRPEKGGRRWRLERTAVRNLTTGHHLLLDTHTHENTTVAPAEPSLSPNAIAAGYSTCQDPKSDGSFSLSCSDLLIKIRTALLSSTPHSSKHNPHTYGSYS